MKTQLHYIYIKERKARRHMEKEFLKSPAEVKKLILARRKLKTFYERLLDIQNFIDKHLSENNPRT